MANRTLLQLEGSLCVLEIFGIFHIRWERFFLFSLFKNYFLKLFNAGGKVVCLNFVDVFLGLKFGIWYLCYSDSKL